MSKHRIIIELREPSDFINASIHINGVESYTDSKKMAEKIADEIRDLRGSAIDWRMGSITVEEA